MRYTYSSNSMMYASDEFRNQMTLLRSEQKVASSACIASGKKYSNSSLFLSLTYNFSTNLYHGSYLSIKFFGIIAQVSFFFFFVKIRSNYLQFLSNLIEFVSFYRILSSSMAILGCLIVQGMANVNKNQILSEI